MSNPLKPEIDVVIGGEPYQLRWDKRALYRLGSPEYADAQQDIDESNGPAMFRRVCAYAFCMLVDQKKFKSAEDLAAELQEEDEEPLMTSITKAIEIAKGKESAIDPLSKSGPSQSDG